MISTLKVFIISAFVIGVVYLLLEIYKNRFNKYALVRHSTSLSNVVNPVESEDVSVDKNQRKDSIDIYADELTNQIREEVEELTYENVMKTTLLSQLSKINDVQASDEPLINSFSSLE